eukprot:TRINITY_DN28291_c0_g1_i1.p1 TRINITY_DN28291_c0_g1~~TRINITY_DN28291_c0_g1_i1.p1  ORF type:complete len:233 (-),score=39.07 TRINITY_DN28291_c0_g1_i1:60-758(-)
MDSAIQVETLSLQHVDHFVVKRTLGTGSSASVVLAEDPDTHKSYAIKLFNSSMTLAEAHNLAKNESEILSRLQHENIVKIHTFFSPVDVGRRIAESEKVETSKFKGPYLVLGLAASGDLFRYLEKAGPLPHPVARYFFKQLLEALHYMHSNDIAHCDLKIDNLLLDENYNLVLADFGFACFCAKEKTASSWKSEFKGTKNYMAPEILAGRPYCGSSVDMFAAGVILLSLIHI